MIFLMDAETKPSAYVGRLAPAPTGALHLGNARTFLAAWLRARAADGRLLLRLEDLDHPKVKPHAAAQAYDDLRWLGLDWDGEPMVQSSRQAFYGEIMERLRRAGRLYPCICTRKDLETYQSAPNAGEDRAELRYPGRCRDRYPDAATARAESGREPAWRFRIEDDLATCFDDGFHGRQCERLADWSGDFPVARGDQAGYQLAVVADDHAMGVTEVVRGDDLLASTHRQLALYHALGWEPPAFFHVPLVVGPDGRRLAKRHGDTRLSLLRERGDGPGRVLGWLARTLGLTDKLEEADLATITKLWNPGLMPREKTVVQPDDMAWMGFA